MPFSASKSNWLSALLGALNKKQLGLLLVGLYYAYKRWLQKRAVQRGKVVLITGGGSGIGRNMAKRWAKLGARVVLWDVNQVGLDKVAAEIKALSTCDVEPVVFTARVDISDPDQVRNAATQVSEHVGTVDVLVNNAGIVAGKYITDLTDGQIQKVFAVNTLAHFYTIRAFLPAMILQNSGHIVTISSASGVGGCVKLTDYSASKFAAFGLDESLRMELKHRGVTGVGTTVVCPYFINTGMFDGVNELRGFQRFVLPILEEDYVATKVIDSVQTNNPVLMMPRMIYLGSLMRFFLPVWLFDKVYFYLGINASMDTFKGRAKE